MYTIKEVSELMDVSEHTLRFWDKSGFFPFVSRDRNNIRQFSNEDLDWIKIVKCLRSVGTENKDIKRYIDLCLEGDSTIQERYEIILTTKARALNELEELKKQIEHLEYKETYYKKLISGDCEDKCNPLNSAKKEKVEAVC